jgi:hypothetical protein
MERFYWVWIQTNAVTVTLELSQESMGSEEYVQIRATLQLATIKLNFI